MLRMMQQFRNAVNTIPSHAGPKKSAVMASSLDDRRRDGTDRSRRRGSTSRRRVRSASCAGGCSAPRPAPGSSPSPPPGRIPRRWLPSAANLPLSSVLLDGPFVGAIQRVVPVTRELAGVRLALMVSIDKPPVTINLVSFAFNPSSLRLHRPLLPTNERNGCCRPASGRAFPSALNRHNHSRRRFSAQA